MESNFPIYSTVATERNYCTLAVPGRPKGGPSEAFLLNLRMCEHIRQDIRYDVPVVAKQLTVTHITFCNNLHPTFLTVHLVLFSEVLEVFTFMERKSKAHKRGLESRPESYFAHVNSLDLILERGDQYYMCSARDVVTGLQQRVTARTTHPINISLCR